MATSTSRVHASAGTDTDVPLVISGSPSPARSNTCAGDRLWKAHIAMVVVCAVAVVVAAVLVALARADEPGCSCGAASESLGSGTGALSTANTSASNSTSVAGGSALASLNTSTCAISCPTNQSIIREVRNTTHTVIREVVRELGVAGAPSPPQLPVTVLVYVDETTGNYTAMLSNGANASSATILASANASAVLNAAIDALPSLHGGTVAIRGGVYHLTHPIRIERHSVELRGENGAGDSFFTADAFYPGFQNKMATVLVAPTGDAIQIGMTTFVLGVAVRDLGITGLAVDEATTLPPDGLWAVGAGIRGQRVDTIRVEGVQVVRKEYGVKLGPVGGFAWDNVVDVVTVTNLMVSYCGFGLFASGWVANVRVRSLFGYLNQWGLLHKSGTIGQYDWLVDGVTSQADAWNAATVPAGLPATPIYLATAQELSFSNAVVEALKGSTLATVPLVQLVVSRAGTSGDEWYRGHISMTHVSMFSTAADAMRAVGNGMVDMRDVHVGSTGSQALTGGDGRILNHILKSFGPDVDVSIDGGFVHSELVDPALWFVGVRAIRNVRGFNPVGHIPAPFFPHSANVAEGAGSDGLLSPCMVQTSGLGAATPQPGVWYTVFGVDVLVSASGPQGQSAGANVTVSDPRGVTVVANAPVLAGMLLPVGYRMMVGAAVSTITVFGN